MVEDVPRTISDGKMHLPSIRQSKVADKGYSRRVDREDTGAHCLIRDAAFHSIVDKPAHKSTRVINDRKLQPPGRSRLAEVQFCNPLIQDVLLFTLKGDQEKCSLTRKTGWEALRLIGEIFDLY